MEQIRTPLVLGTFSAAAASDITTDAGYLIIANATNSVPPMYYPLAKAALLPSVTEVPSVWTATGAYAASTTYSFFVNQYNRAMGTYISYPVIYQSKASDTDANVATRLTAAFNAQTVAYGGTLNASIAGAAISTGLTITGGTGDPIFILQSGQGVTLATSMLLTPTIASNTTAAQTEFTTSAAHGLTVGQIITITTSDVTKFVAGTYRIDSSSGVTKFKLTQLDGVTPLAGTATATGTITKVGSKARGTYALVNAVNGLSGTPVSGHTYSQLSFHGAYPDAGMLTDSRTTNYFQQVFFDESATNYAAFIVGLLNELQGLNLAGSAADPNLISAS